MLAEQLWEKSGFSEVLVAEYRACHAVIGTSFEELAQKTMAEAIPVYDSCQKARTLAPTLPAYTADLMFLLECTGYLLENYRERQIPDQMFYDAMQDLRCKAEECLRLKQCFGTFVGEWFNGFFALTRFAFGRLQYDVTYHWEAPIRIGAHTVESNELVLRCHIPSLGPLRHEQCVESYRAAYRHFKNSLKHDRLVIRCDSWLLAPFYRELFRECSPNIYRFARDFTLFATDTAEQFADAWRVFNKELIGRDTAPLPADTRLQRGFITHIQEGGLFGHGRGILLFDGNEILTDFTQEGNIL